MSQHLWIPLKIKFYQAKKSPQPQNYNHTKNFKLRNLINLILDGTHLLKKKPINLIKRITLKMAATKLQNYNISSNSKFEFSFTDKPTLYDQINNAFGPKLQQPQNF